MAANLVDLVKIKALTIGTGAIVLGDAAPGYRGKEALINGGVYSYAIQQGAEYEIGRGTWLAANNTFVRAARFSSDGGVPIDLQANASVSFVLLAEDLATQIFDTTALDAEIARAGGVEAELAREIVFGAQAMASYETVAALPTSPTPTNGQQARVWGDSTSSNNGVWKYAAGAWAFDADYYAAIASAVQPLVDEAQAAEDAAAASAAAAEGAAGPTYANTTAGLAATDDGQAFAVDNGDGTITVYLNSSGTAVAQRTLATTAALAASTGASLVGWIRSAAGAIARTLTAKLFGYVDVEDFGAVGDGTTDDTAAWTAAIAYVKTRCLKLRAMSPSYLVSMVTFTGSNYSVETNGCLFKQVPGTVADVLGPPAVVRFISATNVTCGSLRVQGNIATDTGESNHGVNIASCKNVSIGDIYVTDVRGDGLYAYARNTSDAERQSGVFVQSISGTNVYRNLLSPVGGQLHVGAVINDGPVGFRDIDVEPNNASGTYEAVDLTIDYARIGSADITSDDAAIINHAVRIGILDADNSRVAATTPAYPGAPGTGGYGLGVNRCDTVEIGHFRARNYNVYALSLNVGWSHVNIGTFDVANCSLTDVTYNTMILQQGNAGAGMLRIGTLMMDAANTKYLARVVGTGLLKIEVGGIALWKGLIGVQVSGRLANGDININSGSGVALASATGIVFDNVTTSNYGSATFTSGCANVVGFNSALFEATRREMTLPIGGGVYNAGNKVLGARVTGWGAATGTATRATFVTGSVTLPQLAEHVKALIDDLIAHGTIGA